MNEWVLANLKELITGLGQHQGNVRKCSGHSIESSRSLDTVLELKFTVPQYENDMQE